MGCLRGVGEARERRRASQGLRDADWPVSLQGETGDDRTGLQELWKGFGGVTSEKDHTAPRKEMWSRRAAELGKAAGRQGGAGRLGSDAPHVNARGDPR